MDKVIYISRYMVKALFTKFNQFQSRFTYRQRFVFFALVFFIFVPPPAYWLLHSQSFFLNRAKLESLGNRYQQILGNLLFRVTRHEVLTSTTYLVDDDLTDEIDSLKKLIYADLRELDTLQTRVSPPQTYYGEGFSNPKAQVIDFSLLKQYWKDISQTPKQLSLARKSELHNRLIEELLYSLRQLRYVYGFMLSPEIVIHYLSEVTLVRIPESESLIAKIYTLGLKMRSDEMPTEDDLVNLVHYISLLQTNLKSTQAFLSKSFGIYDDLFHVNRDTLRDARDYLNDYTDNVQQYLHFISNTPTERVNKTALVNNLLTLGTKGLKSSVLLRDINIRMIEEVLDYRKEWLLLTRGFTIGLLTLCTITIIFFVVFRILSSHLNKVLENIRKLARGYFPKEELFSTSDEFGKVGIAFQKMSLTLTEFVSKLQELVQQLADSSTQISRAIALQKSNLTDQETNIKRIEFTAKQIARNSRFLADKMSELGLGVKDSSPVDKAQRLLDGMSGTTACLTTESMNIMNNLRDVQEKVDRMNPLFAFMTRVNDKARLLYLNAAIEASEAGEHTKSFSETTQKIKRFADNSATSTNEIQGIIVTMSSDVTAMRQEIFRYLAKFTSGLQRLTLVNHQLSNITEQVDEQTNQFAIVNHMMQEQATEAENIIQSLSHIRLDAEKNSKEIEGLQQIVKELQVAAEQLNAVLTHLFDREEQNFQQTSKRYIVKDKRVEKPGQIEKTHVL